MERFLLHELSACVGSHFPIHHHHHLLLLSMHACSARIRSSNSFLMKVVSDIYAHCPSQASDFHHQNAAPRALFGDPPPLC